MKEAITYYNVKKHQLQYLNLIKIHKSITVQFPNDQTMDNTCEYLIMAKVMDIEQ